LCSQSHCILSLLFVIILALVESIGEESQTFKQTKMVDVPCCPVLSQPYRDTQKPHLDAVSCYVSAAVHRETRSSVKCVSQTTQHQKMTQGDIQLLAACAAGTKDWCER
jgi:hypothetical protein